MASEAFIAIMNWLNRQAILSLGASLALTQKIRLLLLVFVKQLINHEWKIQYKSKTLSKMLKPKDHALNKATDLTFTLAVLVLFIADHGLLGFSMTA